MQKIRRFLWIFVKHLYTIFILLASDPFDIAERWFHTKYQPPHFLFWLLLIIAVGSAVYLSIRSYKKSQINVVSTPTTKTTQHDKLVESLINVRTTAEELIKLDKKHNIDNTSPSGRGVVIRAKDSYKSAIKKLEKERRSKYRSLKISLLRGQALVDKCLQKNDISNFKRELDTNSKEIIRQIDEIVGS